MLCRALSVIELLFCYALLLGYCSAIVEFDQKWARTCRSGTISRSGREPV